MTGKTYIDFLNDNFEIGFGGLARPKESCPIKSKIDATLGGFPRVLMENMDQYTAPTGMTLNKMYNKWRKQAAVKK